MTRQNQIDRSPILPNRVRKIGGRSFAFIPHRFVREGFLATMSHDELLLYFFLALAADRHGISFYHYDRICSLLMLDIDGYLAARDGLIRKDLLAFDGTRFQLLSLPEKPVSVPTSALVSREDLEDHDPATIRGIIRASLRDG
jgi:hypothetical protein